MYTELSSITGILFLWLISLDFQQNKISQNADRVKIQEILNHYEAICKLSAIFSQAYGIVLLFDCLNGVLYYSCFIGDYILTLENPGREFFMLEYLFIFLTLLVLGTTFANLVNLQLEQYDNWVFNTNFKTSYVHIGIETTSYF